MVSVIIVNYNTRQLTTSCIRSVYEKTIGVSFEIILVDNNSTECDAAVFQEQFPGIKLIKSDRNLGFAGGNNAGISQAAGEYILLLNSDTELVNDAITISVEIMDQDREIGVLSAQLIYPDGSPQPVTGRFPSLKNEVLEFLRMYKFESAAHKKNRLQGDLWDYSIPVETDWVWGAFFLIPKPLLEKFPGKKLHDDFFMYFEDVQWCWYIKQQLHKKIVYAPQPVVLHHLSGSSENKDAKVNFKHKILPNQRRFLLKEHGQLYTSLFYFFKAIHFLSLRGRTNKIQAREYFRLAFQA